MLLLPDPTSDAFLIAVQSFLSSFRPVIAPFCFAKSPRYGLNDLVSDKFWPSSNSAHYFRRNFWALGTCAHHSFDERCDNYTT